MPRQQLGRWSCWLEINGWGAAVNFGLRSSIEVGKEVKTVNYVNYEFSGERWLAGSGFRVTLGDVDINKNFPDQIDRANVPRCR